LKQSLLFCAFFIFSGKLVFAQQDAQFSQYMFNQLYVNPAFSGIEESPRFTFYHRTQWLGYSTSSGDPSANPVTQLLSFNTRALKGGIGAYIINDVFGSSNSPLRNFQAQLSYAYHLKFAENILSIGLKAGVYYQYIDVSRWRPPSDPVSSDPTLQTISQNGNQTNMDFAFGLWYQAEKFYFGASINHLQRSSLKFNSAGNNNNLANHTYLTSGYSFRLNENLNFRPSILVKTDFNTFSVEPTALLEYSNYKIWGGLSYRSGDAVVAMLGLSLLRDNTLRVGYGFDYTVIGLQAKALTSHEIMISYLLPPTGALNKPVIKTPRFAF